jgi:hypothetical protein
MDIRVDDFRTLADLTQQLYLGMPSFGASREQRWRRKTQRFRKPVARTPAGFNFFKRQTGKIILFLALVRIGCTLYYGFNQLTQTAGCEAGQRPRGLAREKPPGSQNFVRSWQKRCNLGVGAMPRSSHLQVFIEDSNSASY